MRKKRWLDDTSGKAAQHQGPEYRVVDHGTVSMGGVDRQRDSVGHEEPRQKRERVCGGANRVHLGKGRNRALSDSLPHFAPNILPDEQNMLPSTR